MKPEQFPEDIRPHLIPVPAGDMVYRCLECGGEHGIDELLYTCPKCRGLLLLEDRAQYLLREYRLPIRILHRGNRGSVASAVTLHQKLISICIVRRWRFTCPVDGQVRTWFFVVSVVIKRDAAQHHPDLHPYRTMLSCILLSGILAKIPGTDFPYHHSSKNNIRMNALPASRCK